MERSSVWAWGVCLALVGCHDATKDEVSDPDDTDVVADTDVAVIPTIASLCDRLATEICDGLKSCDCRFDVRPFTADSCVAYRKQECDTFLSVALQADLDAGRVVLDAARATDCLDGVRAMADACAVSWTGGLPVVCSTMFTDAAALSEPCVAQGNGTTFCAGGAGICVYDQDHVVCQARPTEGQDCPQGDCVDGLRCSSEGKCVVPGPADQTCTTSVECADGLVCGAAGTCIAPAAVGAACAEDGQCAEGLRCDESRCAAAVPLGGGCYGPDECGAERSCGRAPETRTCSTPDTLDQTCRDGTCADGLLCGSQSQLCEALPGVDEDCLDGFACEVGLTCADGLGTCMVLPGQGETCATGNRFCDDGLGCDFNTNTCQPGPGLGADCLINPPDYVCADGLGCDFGPMGSKCMELGGAGIVCNSDRTCASGTFCDYSTLLCTDRYADGAACSAGNECAEGSSCALRPSGFECAPIPVRGEPCTDVCDEGSVCKGPGGQCVVPFCVIE